MVLVDPTRLIVNCSEGELVLIPSDATNSSVRLPVAVAVFVALAFGITLSTYLLVREREARRQAAEARQEAEGGRVAVVRTAAGVLLRMCGEGEWGNEGVADRGAAAGVTVLGATDAFRSSSSAKGR